MDIEDLKKHRKQNFAVKINEVPGGSFYDDEKTLYVTHNGNQWSLISLTKPEALEVIKVLSKWVEEQ